MKIYFTYLFAILFSFGLADLATAQDWEFNGADELYSNTAINSIGIGVTNPNGSYKLHIDGGSTNVKHGIYVNVFGSRRGIYSRSPGGTGVSGSTSTGFGIQGNATSGTGVYGNSNTGKGVYANSWAGQSVYARTVTGHAIYAKASINGTAGFFEGRVEVDGNSLFDGDTRITGKTTIGTNNAPQSVGGENISSYHLFVQGGILTDEVRVRVGWADYVFDQEYNLPSLPAVNEFIKKNGHLPNVPSEQEVLNDGLGLGDMTRIQQEKIEELFLHLIELDKKVSQLQEENQQLKMQLKVK